MKKNILIIVFFTIISCTNENAHNFSPLESIKTTEQNYNLSDDLKIYDLKSEIDIPDYIGQIYDLRSSWGSLFLSDNNSVYKLEQNKIIEYFSPGKGRGPEEVTKIFRFDVIKDSLLVIAGYPDQRILLYNSISDSVRIIQTEYRNDVLFGASGEIIGVNPGHTSNKMFQKLSYDGQVLNEFGQIFNNQFRSLNAFNLWVGTNNTRENFVVSFLYAGYYAGFKSTGDLSYLTESTRYPGELPSYVSRGEMTYIDNEGRVSSNSMGVSKDNFHIVSKYLADKRTETLYGTVVDVIDIDTGLYQYSYQLERVINNIVVIDENNIAGITDEFKLALWGKNVQN